MKEAAIPMRDERKVCYIARDAFFTCCDRNNIDNPMRDGETAKRMCGAEKARFEKKCMASWVIPLSAVPLLTMYRWTILCGRELSIRERICSMPPFAISCCVSPDAPGGDYRAQNSASMD
jgi:Cytochrome oxidase c subunit VIb